MTAPAPPLTDDELADMDDHTLRGEIAKQRRRVAECDRHKWAKDAAIARGRMDRALEEMLRRGRA